MFHGKFAPVISSMLEKDKNKRPFMSEVLQIEPISIMTKQIVLGESFQNEMRYLVEKKVKLGFARKQEFDFFYSLNGDID